ncbi:MAG: hypothetical protein CM1200mP14_04120 [Gammaproteobacteria bacterium]|nr:MAG: hypothetical protein CM1200mP14_04120 [Gammaproteobacteria bacterium]
MQAELEELAASIAENGLLQPIVVRAAAGAEAMNSSLAKDGCARLGS